MNNMLTVKNVAERLAVADSTVYALVQNGLLPHLRIGCGRGAIRVAESDLAEFIERSRITNPLPQELRHIKVRG